MSEDKSKNRILIHAVPVSYRQGLSLVQLARVLRHFASAINHPTKRVIDSFFVNVDEYGTPHLIYHTGSNGKSFETVDEAVVCVRASEGDNLGVVVAAYDTKRGRLRGTEVQDAEIYDIPHVYNISGGTISQHRGLWRLFQYSHTTYRMFCEALPGIRAFHEPRESVFRARGSKYFEQDWLHHFTGLLNQMRYEMLGPEQYTSARFFKKGEDPLVHVREVRRLMNGNNGFADGKKAAKVYNRFGEIEKALEKYQPEIKGAIDGLSLATIKPTY